MTAGTASVERSYLAGIGASGALVAAAVVAAVALIAFVAFDAWPSGGGDGQAEAVQAAQTAPVAGSAAATALAPGANAVAANPASVVLARSGNPNSVVTPGDLQAGGGGSTPGGGGSGSIAANPGGATTDNPVGALLTSVNQTASPITTPLLQTIGGVGGTLGEALGIVPPLDTTLPTLDETLTNTVVTVNNTLTGLTGQPAP